MRITYHPVVQRAKPSGIGSRAQATLLVEWNRQFAWISAEDALRLRLPSVVESVSARLSRQPKHGGSLGLGSNDVDK